MFLRSALVLALLWALPVLADSPLIGLKRIEQASPWKAVGRLETGDGGYCTATLIAPDLVLSAAHCIFEKSGKRRAASELMFRAGFRNGRVEAERKVLQTVLPEAYQYRGGDWLTRVANDVVLLRLSTPIATHIIDPFIVEPRPMRRGEVSVVSYGRGRDSLPSLQHTCQVLDSYRGAMVMDCNTTFGSSGAPVFRRDGTKTRIASIVSGSVEIDGTRRTTGMALPALVTRLKAKMIAEGAPPKAQLRRIGVGTRASGGAKFIRSGGS
ncbi:trypsin-like peptidase domain-containing protein [Sulfitobacter sp. F26169L]|uniref:trypsin-like serine peptidase n=1 Tax=Sulfitobacter sp. F26169L TaxID=2996015 RepID=UPI002260EC82|nr:trypsin-like peptidase domain-containing protein [Sulfitobacter sp. F26169L]MCX7566543.1 trypsin-like peptidase domain-containing protein [Sulfitobacter sp. F26169L]